ncbi:hypothetical protein TNCV_2117341 [Trichonephila clavipes]|nr:hypothetical protein TNCV_2117341 [Trichonephila clavipes]
MPDENSIAAVFFFFEAKVTLDECLNNVVYQESVAWRVIGGTGIRSLSTTASDRRTLVGVARSVFDCKDSGRSRFTRNGNMSKTSTGGRSREITATRLQGIAVALAQRTDDGCRAKQRVVGFMRGGLSRGQCVLHSVDPTAVRPEDGLLNIEIGRQRMKDHNTPELSADWYGGEIAPRGGRTDLPYHSEWRFDWPRYAERDTTDLMSIALPWSHWSSLCFRDDNARPRAELHLVENVLGSAETPYWRHGIAGVVVLAWRSSRACLGRSSDDHMTAWKAKAACLLFRDLESCTS